MFLERLSLTTRIVASMICMVAVVAATYCFAVYYGIHLTESSLVGSRMKTTLDAARLWQNPGDFRARDLSVIFATVPGKTTQFHPVPDEYKSLPDGFQEISDGEDYFLYKHTDEETGAVWVMLLDQGGFETKEKILLEQAGLGLVLALLISVFLGFYLSHAVARPVKRLSEEVTKMSASSGFKPLSFRPTRDEIGNLALTLEKTLYDYDQALQRERAFTADVSHEIRTPLMVISSSLEVLKLPNTPETEREHCLKSIAFASERLNRLIQVFMELARGKALASAHKQPIDEVLTQAVAIWKEAAEKKSLTLTFLNHATKTESVNAPLVLSVADNLIRNAVQYTETGSITVTLTDTDFAVADTGIGIDNKEREAVLARFVRGQSAKGEGYGLGLSLVVRICRYQGWLLSMTPNTPKGTIFRVTYRTQMP